VKVTLSIELPDALALDFMQAIRDFDMKHDPNHEGLVKVQALSESDLPLIEMQKIFQSMEPPPGYSAVIMEYDHKKGQA
jgi:hypothetical protein